VHRRSAEALARVHRRQQAPGSGPRAGCRDAALLHLAAGRRGATDAPRHALWERSVSKVRCSGEPQKLAEHPRVGIEAVTKDDIADGLETRDVRIAGSEVIKRRLEQRQRAHTLGSAAGGDERSEDAIEVRHHMRTGPQQRVQVRRARSKSCRPGGLGEYPRRRTNTSCQRAASCPSPAWPPVAKDSRRATGLPPAWTTAGRGPVCVRGAHLPAGCSHCGSRRCMGCNMKTATIT
jgi:hypothetical protein